MAAVTSTLAQFAPNASRATAADAAVPDAEGTAVLRERIDERTTLETCTANYGGEKVSAFGFFGSTASDGSLNRAKSGHKQRLEYRLVDRNNDCVIFDPVVPVADAQQVDCTDTTQVIGPGGSFSAPRYERKARQFRQYWFAPKGKDRCYRVSVSGLIAFFRTK